MARDFGSAESTEIAGILCVFPNFGTARMGAKGPPLSRRRFIQRFLRYSTFRQREVHPKERAFETFKQRIRCFLYLYRKKSVAIAERKNGSPARSAKVGLRGLLRIKLLHLDVTVRNIGHK